MGWWQTESSKVASTFEEGEYAGKANPADIRGSYTFGDVEKNFGVPAAILGEAFTVQTENPAAFQVKELEQIYAESGEEIGTSSVRLFVAFYTGLPFDLSSEIYLPIAAVKLLENTDLSSERRLYLERHSVLQVGREETPAVRTPVNTESAPAAEGSGSSSSEERNVRGKTTFQELLDWGLTQAEIEEIMGMPVANLPGTVKDFCTANGLNFETIKPALQTAVDQQE